MPVLEHYPDEIVSTIDANGSPVEILRRILDAVIPAQNICFTTNW